jgi:GTP pyrophosphokinase
MATRIDDIIEDVRSYHPSADVTLIQKAYVYSARVHAGQVRKSGEPYLVHPLEVARLLARLRLDESSIATGLLHDTVEDTLATAEELRELFGPEIAALVDGVTKLSQIRFDGAAHKQAENFRKMLVAMAKDIRVILVKLCDRLHNMQTLRFLPPAKQHRIAQETLELYAPLANRLGIHWMKSTLEDLAFQALHPDEFRALEERITSITQEREDYVAQVIGLVLDNMRTNHLEGEVVGRPKHLYSVHKKMLTRQIEFERVYDLIAFRVIVDTVPQCYEVLGLVHGMWRPIPGRFKDYIAMPKPNGYRSLHTSVVGPGGERIEIQIRTRQMHDVNEEGIAAHWEYKEGAQNSGRQQFAWLRQLLEWQQDLKDPTEFLDTVRFDLFSDEVFVFTPQGEVLSLHRGSTPVDFAYSIHTEVGNHCAGAKVNGRMMPLRTELKNGDMVEILTNKQQRPSKDWLAFVKTGRAKTKIRSVVRAEERQRSCTLGEEILDRELRRYDRSLQKALKSGVLAAMAAESRHKTVEGLFVALGYGKTTATDVIKRLFPDMHPAEDAGETPRPAPKRRATGGVVVQGIEDVLIRYGRCCSPVPGEPVVGFVTRGRGITVHSRSCTRAIDADPERRIEVDWDQSTEILRPVQVRVLTSDAPGILANISQSFTEQGINIVQANCKVTDFNRAINTFEVMVRGAVQLRQVMARIRTLKGVMQVDRL